MPGQLEESVCTSGVRGNQGHGSFWRGPCFRRTYTSAVQIASSASTIGDWWGKINSGKDDALKKKCVAASVYIIWHIWKERGRRIFQDEAMTASAVAALVRADLELLFLAKDRSGGY